MLPLPAHRTIRWSIFLNLLVRLCGAAATLRTTPETGGRLRMRDGGSPFKIAIFADLHFGEDAWTEWGPQQDLKSLSVMSTVLDKERPDFVIFLGDVITANNIMTENASLYWDQALSPTRARAIPYCSVFGNHDDAAFEWPMEWFSKVGIPTLDCLDVNLSLSASGEECSFRGTTRLELLRSEIQYDPSLSYTKGGPQTLWPSVSNYVLKLLSPDNNQEGVLYMYFFDSGGGSYPKVVSDAQVNWFLQESEKINPDSSVPEIIFWHIPSQAYEVASKQQAQGHCVGSIFLEDIAPQESEMGMMGVLEKRPSVKAVFVGHNHGLDWCCPYEKLWLCFARHTGYGGYGSWARGVKILEINRQPFSLKSWIRMEDGETHSQGLLSS